MATTNYPVNHPNAVKHWAPEVFKEALKRTYAMRFMGAGTGSLCQIRNEMKSEGDRVRVNLRMQLSGEGIAGDGTLEGNEEALSIYTDDVYIDQLRHAVRSGGKMSEQRVPFEVRDEAKDGLADWWADRIDSGFFAQLGGNSDQTNTKYTGMQAATAPTDSVMQVETSWTANTTASLSTSDTMNLKGIDYCVEKARTRTLPMRSLKIGGKEYYVMFMSEEQATDLRTNTATGQWLDIQKAAMSGGETTGNPIFTGALGVYNGTILHATTRLPTAGGVANTARAVFCGAQAAAIAFGKGNGPSKMSWVEELFDYENQLGVAAGCIWGLKKLTFNSVDLSSIVYPTYAVSHGR